jgi:hypothetical protein
MEKYLKLAAKAPIYFYRYAISPLIGPSCRYSPTCSQYALDAIDKNGVWIGGWLTAARIARCRPGGSSGYDPAPDLTHARIPFWAPWRYWQYRRTASPAPLAEEGHG